MKFKALILSITAVCLVGTAEAQTRVRGYTRKDGTYVQPHTRSSPNSSRLDNYSTRGNVNPYTGRVGTTDPYAATRSPYSYNRPSGSSYSTETQDAAEAE